MSLSQSLPKMDIHEFRESGYLLEVNRQFFHPLGLALAVQHDDETDEWSLYCIYDIRHDPEGFVFGEITEDDQRRALKIQELAASRVAARAAMSPHFDPETGIQRLTPHRLPDVETPVLGGEAIE